MLCGERDSCLYSLHKLLYESVLHNKNHSHNKPNILLQHTVIVIMNHFASSHAVSGKITKDKF